MSIPVPPGDVGRRLLPAVVDDLARSDPHRVLYSILKTKQPRDGFQDISAIQFSRAVSRCAWYIHAQLGPGVDFPTVLYIGPQDLVYAILTLACIKTGYKLLLTSPRNTLEAHLFLAKETSCTAMFVPPAFPLPVIGKILEAASLRAVDLPGAAHWLAEDEPVDAYPYDKTYAEARLEPWVVLHTSGTTGMPKPIVQTHATYSPLDACTALPSLGLPDTYPSDSKGRRVYLGFPLFHCGGISMLLPCSIFGRFTIVLGPFPPSPEVIAEIHEYGDVQESLIAPSTLVDMAKVPAYLESFSRLDRVVFGGGTLPKEVGDIINIKTRLASVLGTTEAGVVPLDPADREDWAYMKISPVLGVEYRQVSDDLYEQVIVKKDELQLYQPIFGTFPNLQEWPMKDLYSKHPTKENTWLYRGRADDIIVYTTGEKLNPVDMEGIIQAHPTVQGAIICGMGRFQSSLLLEVAKPPQDGADRERLLSDIWPFVENANKASPSHGRIHRDMILFTAADRPMPRAGKGTVQRQATVALYKEDLDKLYASSEIVSVNGRLDTLGDSADISQTVKTIISVSTDISVAEIAATDNLFELGLDSLQIMTIVKNVNKYLVNLGKPPSMDQRLVYSNPSVEALIVVVTALCKGGTPASSAKTAIEEMQRLYNLNVSHLPITARKPQPQTERIGVLLTGSTGSLGSYILDSLVREGRIDHIFCLNRGPRSLDRQHESQVSKGLSLIPSDKITFLEGSLSQEYFGLAIEDYKTLLHSVGLVIQNAWPVNFNLPLASFSPQIASVRRLVDFSSHSLLGARIFFVSTISSVSNHSGASDHDKDIAVSEHIVEDWTVAEPGGYGQSKLISERVLDAAAQQADVPTSVCRVGQIAGPTTAEGMWSRQEWLPSLVASSKFLGKLPASLGRLDQVDWIPVDLLGRVIVELALDSWGADGPQSSHGARVFHAVNSKVAAWADLVPVLQGALGGEEAIDIVPLETWLEALRNSASETNDIEANPALKLLDFFQSLNSVVTVRLETQLTIGASPALAALRPVQVEWVENWARQWSF